MDIRRPARGLWKSTHFLIKKPIWDGAVENLRETRPLPFCYQTWVESDDTRLLDLSGIRTQA